MAQLRVYTLNLLKAPRALIICAFLGSSWLAGPASAATFTFENASLISIPVIGPASPYPSTIAAAGIADQIAKVTVTLFGFTHDYPDDVSALLVGPGGQATFLFGGAGPFDQVEGDGVRDLTWTFDDTASEYLPDDGPLLSGTFKPNSYYPDDDFDPPAPDDSYAQMLSVFDGLSANGDWKLYIQDFGPGHDGSLNGGWSLTITTVPEPTSLALIGLALAGYAAQRRRRTTSDWS